MGTSVVPISRMGTVFFKKKFKPISFPHISRTVRIRTIRFETALSTHCRGRVGYFTVFSVSLSRWLLRNGGGLGGGGLVVALGTRKQGQVTLFWQFVFTSNNHFCAPKQRRRGHATHAFPAAQRSRVTDFTFSGMFGLMGVWVGWSLPLTSPSSSSFPPFPLVPPGFPLPTPPPFLFSHCPLWYELCSWSPGLALQRQPV